MSTAPDLRVTMAAAYALVKNAETNKAVAGLTIDHLIQEQLASLKSGVVDQGTVDIGGPTASSGTSKWDQLDALGNDLTQLADQLNQAGTDGGASSDMGLLPEDTETPAPDEPSSSVTTNYDTGG